MLGYLEATPTSSEPWIWTPSALQNRAKNLHSDILVLNNDIAKHLAKVPAGQLTAWRAYRDGWADWYGKTSASTWLWSATASVLQDYESKLAAWRDWYKAEIGKPSGVGPSTVAGPSIKIDSSGKQQLVAPEKPFEVDYMPILYGLGALVVLGGGYLWWLRRKN